MAGGEEYDKKIRPNIVKIIENVIPSHLLPYLHDCLTKADEEKIQCVEKIEGHQQAAFVLITDHLPKRRNWFNKFMTALCKVGLEEIAKEIDRHHPEVIKAFSTQAPSDQPANPVHENRVEREETVGLTASGAGQQNCDEGTESQQCSSQFNITEGSRKPRCVLQEPTSEETLVRVSGTSDGAEVEQAIPSRTSRQASQPSRLKDEIRAILTVELEKLKFRVEKGATGAGYDGENLDRHGQNILHEEGPNMDYPPTYSEIYPHPSGAYGFSNTQTKNAQNRRVAQRQEHLDETSEKQIHTGEHTNLQAERKNATVFAAEFGSPAAVTNEYKEPSKLQPVGQGGNSNHSPSKRSNSTTHDDKHPQEKNFENQSMDSNRASSVATTAQISLDLTTNDGYNRTREESEENYCDSCHGTCSGCFSTNDQSQCIQGNNPRGEIAMQDFGEEISQSIELPRSVYRPESTSHTQPVELPGDLENFDQTTRNSPSNFRHQSIENDVEDVGTKSESKSEVYYGIVGVVGDFAIGAFVIHKYFAK